MAGEEVEVDEKVPVEKRLQSKTWMQRFLVVIAGVMMNFILAFTLLLIYGIVPICFYLADKLDRKTFLIISFSLLIFIITSLCHLLMILWSFYV